TSVVAAPEMRQHSLLVAPDDSSQRVRLRRAIVFPADLASGVIQFHKETIAGNADPELSALEGELKLLVSFGSLDGRDRCHRRLRERRWCWGRWALAQTALSPAQRAVPSHPTVE